MAYVTSIVGIPTSNITLEARTYVVEYKVCISPEADARYNPEPAWNSSLLWPRALSTNDIIEIPERYNMTGIPSDPPGIFANEFDNDALLRSFIPGAMITSGYTGPDEEEIPAGCMCCRMATATYSAEKFRSNEGEEASNVAELVSLCPRMDVVPVNREEKVDDAKFIQFLTGKPSCADQEDDCDQNNITATRCRNLTNIAAPTEGNVCYPFVEGECRPPMLPNGILLDIFREKTDKIIRIRKYFTTYGDAIAFACHENTVNASDLRINLQCIDFNYTFPAGTLYLRSVGGSPLEVNGSNAWDREYELHFRLCGWRDVFPIEGVERANCQGEADGKFEPKVTDGECKPGTIGEGDCVSAALAAGPGATDVIIPPQNAIVDFEGNPIRTPIPLDLYGRPANRQQKQKFFSEWESIQGTDFTDPALELPGAQPP